MDRLDPVQLGPVDANVPEETFELRREFHPGISQWPDNGCQAEVRCGNAPGICVRSTFVSAACIRAVGDRRTWEGTGLSRRRPVHTSHTIVEKEATQCSQHLSDLNLMCELLGIQSHVSERVQTNLISMKKTNKVTL